MHCYYTPIVYRRFLFQKHWLLCVLINLQESADELINNSINTGNLLFRYAFAVCLVMF